MERSAIINIAKSRVIIDQPGKFMVKVTSVNTHTGEDGVTRQIVNLAAMRADKAAELRAALKSGTATAESLNNTLSFNVLTGKPAPEKGARIYVYADMVQSKRTGGTVLGITGWEPVPVAKSTSFSWDEEAVEEEQPSNELDDVFNG